MNKVYEFAKNAAVNNITGLIGLALMFAMLIFGVSCLEDMFKYPGTDTVVFRFVGGSEARGAFFDLVFMMACYTSSLTVVLFTISICKYGLRETIRMWFCIEVTDEYILVVFSLIVSLFSWYIYDTRFLKYTKIMEGLNITSLSGYNSSYTGTTLALNEYSNRYAKHMKISPESVYFYINRSGAVEILNGYKNMTEVGSDGTDVIEASIASRIKKTGNKETDNKEKVDAVN